MLTCSCQPRGSASLEPLPAPQRVAWATGVAGCSSTHLKGTSHCLGQSCPCRRPALCVPTCMRSPPAGCGGPSCGGRPPPTASPTTTPTWSKGCWSCTGLQGMWSTCRSEGLFQELLLTLWGSAQFVAAAFGEIRQVQSCIPHGQQAAACGTVGWVVLLWLSQVCLGRGCKVVACLLFVLRRAVGPGAATKDGRAVLGRGWRGLVQQRSR